jgi:hypothetical protein
MLIALCFLSGISFLHASTCQYEIKFGEDIFTLNKTSNKFVVDEYGFTENFDYHEYGSLALCYKAEDIFVFLDLIEIY